MSDDKVEKAKQYWLIEQGGLYFWMPGTKEDLIKAGLKVIGGPRA